MAQVHKRQPLVRNRMGQFKKHETPKSKIITQLKGLGVFALKYGTKAAKETKSFLGSERAAQIRSNLEGLYGGGYYVKKPTARSYGKTMHRKK